MAGYPPSTLLRRLPCDPGGLFLFAGVRDNGATSGSMPFHPSTYQYLLPSQEQKAEMEVFREATKAYSDLIEAKAHDGADKTYVLRKLREIGFWLNVQVTREADGTPRPGATT